MAHFQCRHEAKLIVHLLYDAGLSDMRYARGNTAASGDMPRRTRSLGDDTRPAMKQILADIQSGKFANEWINEYRHGLANFKRLRKEAEQHPIEEVGRQLRSFMPWLGSERLVDRACN